MKFLFDLFPVILFFVTYKVAKLNPDSAQALSQQYLGALISGGTIDAKQAPIILATAIAIVATVLQIVYLLARRRKVDGMLWLSLGIISVMGGLTIYFHDPDFIKWKPTLLYWAFALALLVGQLGFKTNLIRKVMEQQIKLPEPVWSRVGYAWALFFVLQGALNVLMAFVVFKNNEDAWVNFKLFGATGLFFAFIVIQTMMISKYIQEPEDA
ncbi:septation protein A [Massilia sp. TN1-12]|jgi:intracellular septation protein|uniref:septation protein A n=1 Tax=Massilia paldalensis TaxID=3377675 RepID=UPI0038504905